jgi:hypothetical protein
MSVTDMIRRMFPVNADDLKAGIAALQESLPMTARQCLAIRRALMMYEANLQSFAHAARGVLDAQDAIDRDRPNFTPAQLEELKTAQDALRLFVENGTMP